MKNLKKALLLVLVTALVALVFAGCNEKKNTVDQGEPQNAVTDNDQPDNNEPEEKTYNIGLIQLAPHVALDAATQGFQDTLKDKLGDKVKFNLQNAAGDTDTCTTIAGQFVQSKVDLIFANATGALQAASAATADIPIVGTSITSYEVALDVDDWATRDIAKNVTGTADLAPLDQQAAMFTELLPDAKNIGLLYCTSEPNSKYQVDVVAEELGKLGLTTKMFPFADSNELASVVTAACGESDALYIPTDNTAADNTEIIDNIAGPANIPIIAGEEGICGGCGIATLSISYYDIGVAAGEMAYDILVNGADPATMEIGFAANLTKKYDAERIAKFGITPPEDYVAITKE